MLRTAIKIIKELQDNGHIAVFAGGCVRDNKLGYSAKDIDIATSATPDEVESLFPHTIPVGKSFGVIIVVENGFEFEVTTLRTDSKASDGRRPDSVEFTTSLREDAKRRDFTMNAMFYDPISDTRYDFFTGEMDIEDKIISCVGEPRLRFEEDKLRMMRAIRFACQLDFDIEEYTWNAICGSANLITSVSWERIKMELDKILLSHTPVKGINMLKRCGILKEILPEVDILDTVEQSAKWHSEGDAFIHTMDALQIANDFSCDLDTLWGVLLHDIGKIDCGEEIDGIIKHTHHASIGAEKALEVMNRLKVSTSHKDAVVGIVRDHMRIKQADKMKKSRVRRLMAEPHFEKLTLASWADSKASIPADPKDGENKFDWFFRIGELEKELENEVVLPKCLIGGKDLIDLGLTPSEKFGIILNEIMNMQLDGDITNKEEAIVIVQEMIENER